MPLLNRMSIIVNGVECKIQPYSEARFEKLMEVQNQINDYIEKNPDQKFGDPDFRPQRAKWYKAKADILWEPTKELPLSFFEAKEFESQRLKETEDFFLANANYL